MSLIYEFSLQVSGDDPYTITAIAFILSAITILKDEANMPRLVVTVLYST